MRKAWPVDAALFRQPRRAQYTEKYYLRAASNYLERARDKGKIGVDLIGRRRDSGSRMGGAAKIETSGGQHIFEVLVHLNDLDPKSVRVELYVDGLGGGDPVRQEMECVDQSVAAPRCFIFRASVSADRPSTDYTARAISPSDGIFVPLEEAQNPLAAVIRPPVAEKRAASR